VTGSLHLRLGIAALLVLAIFIAATGAVLESAFNGSARLATRERMLGQLYLLMAAAEVDDEGRLSMPPSADLPDPQFALFGSGLYAFITNKQNNVVWQSPSFLTLRPPAPLLLRAGERQLREIKLEDGRDYFIYGFGIEWATGSGLEPFTFHVISSLAPLRVEVQLYRQSLWGWLGVMAILLLVTQAVVLRWGLRPLRQVSRELSAIESGEQDHLQSDYPDEIRRLTDNINTLLQQERARQTRYRNALADLAHSLKTPLAVLRGALCKPEVPAATVDEQVTRMGHIVERQLQRAASTGATSASTMIAIRPLAERVLTSLGKVYRDKQVATRNEVDKELRFRGDEADLMEILGNLMDNAFKWCRREVYVEGRREDGRLKLCIHDDGPGLGTHKIGQFPERGSRADETVPGHGIGLAVVMDIVNAYQGQIRFGRSPLLGGAAVTVELPG
jgi:two-component system sensor histidine kinase PhoQ